MQRLQIDYTFVLCFKTFCAYHKSSFESIIFYNFMAKEKEIITIINTLNMNKWTLHCSAVQQLSSEALEALGVHDLNSYFKNQKPLKRNTIRNMVQIDRYANCCQCRTTRPVLSLIATACYKIFAFLSARLSIE